MKSLRKSFFTGCSAVYYLEIVKNMYEFKKDGEFEWKDIYEKYPIINKSIMSKLKSNNIIVKYNYKNDVRYRNLKWKLNPEIKNYLESKKLI